MEFIHTRTSSALDTVVTVAGNTCTSNSCVNARNNTDSEEYWASPPQQLNQKDVSKSSTGNYGGIFEMKTCKIRPANTPQALDIVGADCSHSGWGDSGNESTEIYQGYNNLDLSVVEGWSSNLGAHNGNSCQTSCPGGHIAKRKVQLKNRDASHISPIRSALENSSRSTLSGEVISHNTSDVSRSPQLASQPRSSTSDVTLSPVLFTTSTKFPVWRNDPSYSNPDIHQSHQNMQKTVFQNLQSRLRSSFTPSVPGCSNSSQNNNQFNVVIPHRSNGMPSWHPKKHADVKQGEQFPSPLNRSLTQPYPMTPDLRSIASGGLVDIEIPPSFAGSSISVAGSQITLISSPSRSGSVRRSLSADSLFSLKTVNLDAKPKIQTLLPVRCAQEELDHDRINQDRLQSAIKRASSLDQLPLVSPYPMPTVPCFEPRTKTPEMARSLSFDERASLAMSMDDLFCRICWQGADGEECIQPCFCHSYVHLSCIQRWLSIAKITHCEVCRYQYKAKRKMKPMKQWRWWPNKNRHLAQLEATIILLGVVTPPLLCGIILCSQKIAEYLKTPDNAWKTAGLMTLVMVSAGTYLGAVLYFCHKFATVCRMWVESNRTTVVSVVPLTPAERRPPVLRKSASQVWAIS